LFVFFHICNLGRKGEHVIKMDYQIYGRGKGKVRENRKSDRGGEYTQSTL
jgi:hypothetical protein